MTYQECITDAKALAHDIIEILTPTKFNDLKWVQAKYKAIHPIPAGGISIGVIMAQELGILDILSTEEYKNYANKEEVLVVDDLVDSGKTLLRYPESDTAVLYKKVHCTVEPTYYLKEIGSEWVTFPHEKDKDGILDHLIRVFSFINVQLTPEQEEGMIYLLHALKKNNEIK